MHTAGRTKKGVNDQWGTCHGIIIISLSPYRVFMGDPFQSLHTISTFTTFPIWTHNESSIVLTSNPINGVSKILLHHCPDPRRSKRTRAAAATRRKRPFFSTQLGISHIPFIHQCVRWSVVASSVIDAPWLRKVNDIDYVGNAEEDWTGAKVKVQQTVVVIFAQIDRQAEAPRILFTISREDQETHLDDDCCNRRSLWENECLCCSESDNDYQIGSNQG